MNEFELYPGTFAPENPVIEEIVGTATNAEQEKEAELDVLTRSICDRINPHLSLLLERHGFRSYRPIDLGFPPTQSPPQFPGEVAQPDVLDRLAQDIENLLRQRLDLEQERHGESTGRLPW